MVAINIEMPVCCVPCKFSVTQPLQVINNVVTAANYICRLKDTQLTQAEYNGDKRPLTCPLLKLTDVENYA